ncbi:hypothetical protein CKO51_23500 [Rhodopirellula sp. SM50]|nr:hypothetical protein [Rhodopirellula sp. SM50]PAY17005.1 hypothetical protein CKO51_23500 [Rhodopirellula sp. SM50]
MRSVLTLLMLYLSAIGADRAAAGLIVSDQQSLSCSPSRVAIASVGHPENPAAVRAADCATGMSQVATLQQSHQSVAVCTQPEAQFKLRLDHSIASVETLRLPDWIPICLLKIPI